MLTDRAAGLKYVIAHAGQSCCASSVGPSQALERGMTVWRHVAARASRSWRSAAGSASESEGKVEWSRRTRRTASMSWPKRSAARPPTRARVELESVEEGGKRGHELFEIPEVSEGEQCPKGGSAIDVGAFCTVIVGP